MSSNVRIAVAGAGLIGRRHIEMIGNVAGCTLSAIGPDRIVLATPNQLHVEQALECIAARVPTVGQSNSTLGTT